MSTKKTLLLAAPPFCIAFLSSCMSPADDPELPARGFFMAILPAPADGQNIEDAYKQAAEYADCVPVWSAGTGAAGFWDYADKLRGWWGRTFVKSYIRGNGMFPLIHFSFIDKQADQLIVKAPPGMPDATLSDPEWREAYKQAVLDVMRAARPLYLSVGNEVNRWYEAYGAADGDPNGFQHFVSLYAEIYTAVKAASPETIVFCVFSREIVEENREADLDVLERFEPDTLDMLVFTSYPYAVAGINSTADIPDDYYAEAAAYMPGKPFGFSELGWSSLEPFGGELGQKDFLNAIAGRLTLDQAVDLHLIAWCWLHDLEGDDTTGLITHDGTEKLGYAAWKDISEGTQP